MILTKTEIHREVENGNIAIAPFFPEQLNPNSYNYRLGPKLKNLHPAASLNEELMEEPATEIPAAGRLLEPGKVYLAQTLERIGSKKYVTLLMGRSSIGRLGLFLQLSADLGNLGEGHQWTLELTCVQPIVIYPNMVIGQVTFWKPKGEIMYYAGPYTAYSEPTGNLRPYGGVSP